MKKKILVSIFVVAVVAIAGWNFSQSMSEAALSNVVLANVEALALPECTGGTSPCAPTCTWEWCGYCTDFGGYMQECIYF
jgi:hypothetical protein